MKKFRDKRKFNDVVTTIARAEKDVDNVLKAVRLERVKNTSGVREKINGEDLLMIIFYLGLFSFVFGLMWLATR